MKTSTVASKKFPSKIDDHGKRLKDNDLRIGTWLGVCDQLADAPMKCRKGITAIQEMRWIGHGCKRLASCDMYYSFHVDKHEFGCRGNEESMSNDWNLSVLCPILKKGHSSIWANYRGISFLPIAYKSLQVYCVNDCSHL